MTALTPHEHPARRLWRACEPIHAVCYFHPRFAVSMEEVGLTGGWNGYFAGRSAPLRTTSPPVVAALFYGFAPTMVARAIPKIWTRITPEAAVQARFVAAEAVLAEHIDGACADDLRRATDNLERVIDALTFDGRALAAAWQSIGRPQGLFERLWLATTVLREYRGDGHVIAATGCGLTGLQAAITHIATGQVNRDVLQRNRGWTDDQWEAARNELSDRGILTPQGALTSRGTSLRDRVEDITDELAAATVRTVDHPGWTVDVLTRLARTLVERRAVPIPNPMGVPKP
ncbi:MAG: hypothetical protein U5N53_12020 [Mycobacterium sp.]|nr:hypothetical protein [Mycobacterium sp.]